MSDDQAFLASVAECATERRRTIYAWRVSDRWLSSIHFSSVPPGPYWVCAPDAHPSPMAGVS